MDKGFDNAPPKTVGMRHLAVNAKRERIIEERCEEIETSIAGLKQQQSDAAVARAIATMKGAVEKARSDAARNIAEAKADADAAREDLKDVKASFHDTLQVVLAGDGPSSSTAPATSRPAFFSKIARSIATRLESTPSVVRLGLPYTVGATRACTSTSSGRVPS